jgi:uncharacterized protein YjlB
MSWAYYRFCLLSSCLVLLPITLRSEPREVIVEAIALNKPCGGIPNNALPVLVYHHVLPPDITDGAAYFEHLFRTNGWPPLWRYPAPEVARFHVTTHEVLGVYSGTGDMQLGGDKGKNLSVVTGDVLLIPAGVAYKQINKKDPIMLVGAYPPDTIADQCQDEPAKLANRQNFVHQVSLPLTDPVTGHTQGSLTRWYKELKNK